MALRTITGVLHHLDGTPWSGALVMFSMHADPYTAFATYPQEAVGAITGADGSFSQDLEAGLMTAWVCHMPDGYAFLFAFPDGDATTIERLRAEAIGDPVPVTSITEGGSDVIVVDGEPLDIPLAEAIAALPEYGGTLVLPAGTFTLATPQVATKHVRLVGQGIGNWQSGPQHVITKIVWIGGSQAMFSSNAWTNSWSFDRLMLDGSNVATYCCHALAMVDQEWGPVVMAGGAISSLYLEGQGAIGNTHLNVFQHLVLYAAGTANCLRVDGDGGGNVCHNRFGSLYTGKTGTGTAVYWGDSDNNVVLNTFLYHNNVAYPSIISWDFRANARANYVFHMQVGNMVARSGSDNSISWYDRENGQPAPVIESGASLNYGQNNYGLYTNRITITNGGGREDTRFNTDGTGGNVMGGPLEMHGSLDVTDDDALVLVRTLDPSTTPIIANQLSGVTRWEQRVDPGTGDWVLGQDGGEDAIRVVRDSLDTNYVAILNGSLAIPDGVPTPTTVAGRAFIFINEATGDLSIKFGDGTLRILATD